MQMKNVVSFSLSRVFTLLNNNLSQTLQAAFTPFANSAECYCLDVSNIKINGRGRDYKHGPLVKIQGNKRGVFIIFDELRKKVFCVASSEGQDFYPDKAHGGSKKSGVVRYINGDNPRLEKFMNTNALTSNAYRQFINRHSIFFLCLDPAPNASGNFEQALENLKSVLDGILKPTI